MQTRSFVLCVVATASAFSQTLGVSPLRIVDLRAVVKAATGRGDISVVDIAQSGGRWAALVRFDTQTEAMVIAGDDQDVRFSNVIGSNADRLAMDGDGLLYIRLGGGAPGTTEVEVTDWTFRTSVTHNINQSGLEPLSAGPSVLWRKGDALFRFASPDVVGRLSHPDDQKEWIPEQLVNEVRFVFGFSGQRQVQIGTLSEQVVVRASDGKVLSRTTMALDDAYRLANQKVYQRDPLAGVSRVLWAGVSRNGELVICMSGLPLSGPAYVAIIDPLTGRALRVIAALLPSTLERIDRFNPQGVMFPARGAVDDRLVILDSLGILAVYKLQ